jgi:hypothetical protein
MLLTGDDTSPVSYCSGQLARSYFVIVISRAANRLSLEVDQRRMKTGPAEGDGISPDVAVPLPGKDINYPFHTLTLSFLVRNSPSGYWTLKGPCVSVACVEYIPAAELHRRTTP